MFDPHQAFAAHSGGVTSIAFSSDGSQVATAGYDSIVRLWDTYTWAQIACLPGHRRGHVAFTPDGGHLVSAGLHSDAVVLRTDTWEAATIPGTGGVWGLASAHGSEIVAFIQPDDDAEPGQWWPIELRRVRDWTIAGRIGIGIELLQAIAFAPDAACVAVSRHPGVVSIFAGVFDHIQHEFPADGQAVWALAFSPAGDMLATGGAEGILRLWNVESGELIEERHGEHTSGGAILAIAFSPNGRWLLTGNLDGIVSIR